MQIVVGFWLHNGFRPGQPTNRYMRYFPLLGEVAVPGTTVAVSVQRAGTGDLVVLRVNPRKPEVFALAAPLSRGAGADVISSSEPWRVRMSNTERARTL